MTEEEQKNAVVDEITDDIFKMVMSEMKLDLDLMFIKDQKGHKEEGHSNYFLSESGRFLIFERKGIKTDLFAIERYVEEVLEEIMSKILSLICFRREKKVFNFNK